jgi:hypothetical protein
MVDKEGGISNQVFTFTFKFPIRDLEDEVLMKNISPSTFPNFNGLFSEDPYTFLFEFNVLYKNI